MDKRGFRLEIFLVSLAAILLEIAYTRIFSFKLYYYFTYLVLGIALLGLGSGGVFVAVLERLRRARPERVIAACCLVAGLVVPLSYAVVALVQINTVDLLESPLEFLKLGLICFMLFTPFLLVGIVLATIFSARPGEIDRLYFADLVGAGLGCAVSVPLFGTIGPPGAVLLGGVLLAAAGARLAAGAWRGASWLGASIAVALALLIVFPGLVPDPVPDRIKSMSPQQRGPAPALFSSWSSLFRVDVVDGMTPDKNYVIAHDGIMGSIVYRFDGDWSSLREFEATTRALPYGVLPPGPRVLIIGAAGGHEILASLYFGAREITGVELNGVTISLLTDHFADYSGRIAYDPRVRIVHAEGRSFIKRDHSRYDLIWFVAPDSYSALNAASSGAFVLSESYLYTVEMIVEAMGHLSEDGILCAQFGEVSFDRKPNRTTRYLATAREALRRVGIDDFEEHVLMSTAPGIFTEGTVMLKARAFSEDEVRRFHEVNAAIEGSRVLHAGRSGSRGPRHPVHQVISLGDDELARWHERYPYDVTPVTDDSPFFWHFARYRDALLRPWGEKSLIWEPEDATGERMLMTLLGFAVLFAVVFLLLPLFLVRATWVRVPYKANAAVYFAALGLGFMFFEVCLIQKLTLFLGYPTYSLSVTLFSLLVFSGLGSLLSGRYAGHRNRALLSLLAAVVVLMLLYQFGITYLVEGFVGAPLGVRVALAVLTLVPLGLCLGAFMPIGLSTLATLTEHGRQYVAWGWAVNGFFSVVSSVLATILSMTFGFKVVLLLAAVIYAIGVIALTRVPEPARRPA